MNLTMSANRYSIGSASPNCISNHLSALYDLLRSKGPAADLLRLRLSLEDAHIRTDGELHRRGRLYECTPLDIGEHTNGVLETMDQLLKKPTEAWDVRPHRCVLDFR